MIIALTGKAGSGKSTAADYLRDHYGYTVVSLADPIKSALYTLNPSIDLGLSVPIRLQDIVDEHGWDVAKREAPEIRRLLQVFGTEVGREQWDSYFWVMQADRIVCRLPSEDQAYNEAKAVIPDVRFTNEAEWFVTEGAQLWRIVRPDAESTRAHASENGVSDNYVSSIITNSGTVEDLHREVDIRMVGFAN